MRDVPLFRPSEPVAERKTDRTARIRQAQRRGESADQPVQPEGIPGKNQSPGQMNHRKLQAQLAAGRSTPQSVGRGDQSRTGVESRAPARQAAPSQIDEGRRTQRPLDRDPVLRGKSKHAIGACRARCKLRIGLISPWRQAAARKTAHDLVAGIETAIQLPAARHCAAG